jgi:hypothetical protein
MAASHTETMTIWSECYPWNHDQFGVTQDNRWAPWYGEAAPSKSPGHGLDKVEGCVLPDPRKQHGLTSFTSRGLD